MKALLIFLLISLQMSLAKAQVYPILTDQLVQSQKSPIKNGFSEYTVGEIQLFNGDGKESKYFYILNKNNGAKIFEFEERDSKARRYAPRFFKAEGNDDLIILVMSLEGNYSWGVHIFIIEGNHVYHPGFLPYGEDNFNFASLGLHGQFEQHGDSFVMFFQEDARLINYETDELIEGKDIEFKIEKTQITRIK